MPLLIIGAGGFAREALWLLEDAGRSHQVAGVVSPQLNEAFETFQWFSSDDAALSAFPSGTGFVVAIGNAQLRRKLLEKYVTHGWEPVTLIHPAASISRKAQIGIGSIICAGARVSTDTELGIGCVVNLNACIGHDSRLGNFCTLHPGSVVNGACSLGHFSELGTNAAVLPGVCVGESTIVGMGAMVIRDLPDAVVAAGVPAKIIRKL